MEILNTPNATYWSASQASAPIDLDAEILRFNAIVKAMFDDAEAQLKGLKSAVTECCNAIQDFKANL